MSTDAAPEVEYGHRIHPVLHWFAPVVTIAAVWLAREAITSAYERTTGRTSPNPTDPNTSWKRALAWTAVTTTTAALIEVSVRRLANERRVVRILARGRSTMAANALDRPSSVA